MAHQENPNIRAIHVRCTQTLYRKAEVESSARGMPDVSALVRRLVAEATAGTALTAADRDIIRERIRRKTDRIAKHI